MNEEQLREYLALKGFTNRGCRFAVISDLVGISEEEAKAAERINRYLRKIFPPDKVTKRREKETLDQLGYASMSIHDGADRRLFKINPITS